jgi:hypothetical protein
VKQTEKLSSKIILTFPSGFVFGVVTPLHLIHFYLAPTGKTDVFFKNADGSLPIGEVVVQINRVVIYLCESLWLVGDLETFAELRPMEDIMELK